MLTAPTNNPARAWPAALFPQVRTRLTLLCALAIAVMAGGLALSFLPVVEQGLLGVVSDRFALSALRTAGGLVLLSLLAAFFLRRRLWALVERLVLDYRRVLGQEPPLIEPPQAGRTSRVLFGALALFGLFTAALAILDPARYEDFIVEDGVVEYLTAGFFAAAAALSLVGLLRLPSRAVAARVVYAGATLFLFVCMGEEISWGQRLFGFASPETVATLNKQGEANLHDIGSISIFSNAFFVLTLLVFLGVPRLMRGIPGLRTYFRHYDLPRFHPAVVRIFLLGLGLWFVIGVRFGTLGFHPFSIWGYYTQFDDEIFELVAGYSFFVLVLLDRTCRARESAQSDSDVVAAS